MSSTVFSNSCCFVRENNFKAIFPEVVHFSISSSDFCKSGKLLLSWRPWSSTKDIDSASGKTMGITWQMLSVDCSFMYVRRKELTVSKRRSGFWQEMLLSSVENIYGNFEFSLINGMFLTKDWNHVGHLWILWKAVYSLLDMFMGSYEAVFYLKKRKW